MGEKIIHEKIIFIFKHFASLFIALRVLYIFIRFYFINTFFLFCIFQREEFRICLLFKCAAREEIWEKKTKHVISYFVNKKNKKGRNVDSLFNTWMFHTNVIRRIHDMYKKKAEKKGEPSSNKFILLEHTGWHEFLSCVFSHLSTSHANRDYR